MWAAASDRLRAHAAVFVGMYALSLLVKVGLLLNLPAAALVCAKELSAAPLSVILEALILAARSKVPISLYPRDRSPCSRGIPLRRINTEDMKGKQCEMKAEQK